MPPNPPISSRTPFSSPCPKPPNPPISSRAPFSSPLFPALQPLSLPPHQPAPSPFLCTSPWRMEQQQHWPVAHGGAAAAGRDAVGSVGHDPSRHRIRPPSALQRPDPAAPTANRAADIVGVRLGEQFWWPATTIAVRSGLLLFL
ncbi:hypothetical protein BRADI_3g27492v3 [Brachypodium distachyon]|uniref:PWWP domain-containing protein n=1 Tax=Brachypodium distachyon TaxID=15368 RepID=A0A0Q3FFD8_BRADI|nr:hypothetical protein BRADI_3g27492v3 [Brachypodium distachyon]